MPAHTITYHASILGWRLVFLRDGVEIAGTSSIHNTERKARNALARFVKNWDGR